MLDGAGERVPTRSSRPGRPTPRAGSPIRPTRGRDATSFRGFGRCPTDEAGAYAILTVKPGDRARRRRPSAGAPRRRDDLRPGLAQALVTRLYFADEPAANAADGVLRIDRRRGPAGDARSPARRPTAIVSTSAYRARARRSSSTSDDRAGGLVRRRPARGRVRAGGGRRRVAAGDARGRGGPGPGRGARGLIPGAAADAIGRACQRRDGYRRRGAGSAAAATGQSRSSPSWTRCARPLAVNTPRVDVHRGATSQDILDTAMMLVVATGPAAAARGSCGRGRRRGAPGRRAHRTTLIAGRTLLQQALPTTFGATAAGWLVGLDDAAARLRQTSRGATRGPARRGGRHARRAR